jgi:hypothetical protein
LSRGHRKASASMSLPYIVAAWLVWGSVPVLSENPCLEYKDCSSCVKRNELLNQTACEWCAIDLQCHTMGSPDSGCTHRERKEVCVSTSAPSIDMCAVAAEKTKRPRQVHLALAGEHGMRVAFKTWTMPQTVNLVVTSPSGKTFPSAWERSEQYLANAGYHHVVKVSDLEPGTRYSYYIDCDGSKSDRRSFSVPADDLMDAKFLVVADMGYTSGAYSADTRNRMEMVKASTDLTLHAGDVAYADDSFILPSCWLGFCYEDTYDNYMDWLENVSDNKPYMTAPGNHESECHSPSCLFDWSVKHSLSNFSAYNARFAMPSAESGGVGNMWYSFDYASVHFVFVNTETDFGDAPEGEHGDSPWIIAAPSGHFAPDGAYLKWLEADLKAANENRARRPWVVAIGHRPYNLAFAEKSDSAVEAAHEALFQKYNVDLFIAGHWHNYQRVFPKGDNPATPTIITGGAGCIEFEGDRLKRGVIDQRGGDDQWSWRFFNNETELGLLNATTDSLTFTAIASKSGYVIDEVTVHHKKSAVELQI